MNNAPRRGDFVEFWLHPTYHIGVVERIQGGKARLQAFCIELRMPLPIVKLSKTNLFGLAMEFGQLNPVNPDGIFVRVEGETLSVRELYEAVVNR